MAIAACGIVTRGVLGRGQHLLEGNPLLLGCTVANFPHRFLHRLLLVLLGVVLRLP